MGQTSWTQQFMNQGCRQIRGDWLIQRHVNLLRETGYGDYISYVTPPKATSIKPCSKVWREMEGRYGCTPLQGPPPPET